MQKANGGRGILLGGVPGVRPAKVLVVGGGVAGLEAALDAGADLWFGLELGAGFAAVALLVVVIVALSGVLGSMQTNRVIDDLGERLTKKVNENLRAGGIAQLELLIQLARIELLQRDYELRFPESKRRRSDWTRATSTCSGTPGAASSPSSTRSRTRST